MATSKTDDVSRRKFLLNGAAAMAIIAGQGVVESLAADRKKKKPLRTDDARRSDTPPAKAAPVDDPVLPLDRVDIRMTVNGNPVQLNVPAGKTLAETLRQDLGLTGTKIGCNSAECGACTVLVNARPVYSCRLLAALATDAYVETIEGIATTRGSTRGKLHPLQEAFIEKDALQCGYCTPGMICAAKAVLIRESGEPTAEQVREGLSGNLCRCGAYDHIVEAVRAAARRS